MKMYAVLAPQLAAAIPISGEKNAGVAAAEVSELEDEKMGKTGEKKPAKKKRSLIPTLKSLIAQKGAVAAMLRSILSFLEMRFPLFLTGTNVAMSLSVFGRSNHACPVHARGTESSLLR